jgi:hypothetical protein
MVQDRQEGDALAFRSKEPESREPNVKISKSLLERKHEKSSDPSRRSWRNSSSPQRKLWVIKKKGVGAREAGGIILLKAGVVPDLRMQEFSCDCRWPKANY